MNKKDLDKQIQKVVNNKTIHFELAGQVHRKLRASLFLKELSMQAFFRMIAEKFINDDQYIHQLVNERVDEIKEKKLDKLRDIDEKDLYDAIEKNSPFK